MASEDSVQAIIDNARQIANEKAGQASDFANNAILQSSASYFFDPPSPSFSEAVAPDGLPPDQDLADLVGGLMDGKYTLYSGRLSSRFSSFLSAYFPSQATHLKNLVTKLNDMIQNGGAGLPPGIENAIWERARSRELRDHQLALDEIATDFASRGFSMPQGAMARRNDTATQIYQSRVSTLVREQAIEAARIEVENLQFAITTMAQLRQGAIQLGISYIQAVAKAGIDASAQEAQIVANAKSAYWSAVNEYFNSTISNARLALNFEDLESRHNIQVGQINAQAFTELVKQATQAAVSAAEAMGDIAAAALGSQNTMANLVYETVDTGSGA